MHSYNAVLGVLKSDHEADNKEQQQLLAALSNCVGLLASDVANPKNFANSGTYLFQNNTLTSSIPTLAAAILDQPQVVLISPAGYELHGGLVDQDKRFLVHMITVGSWIAKLTPVVLIP